MLGVVKFFKNRFPEVFDLIYNYETESKFVNGRKKTVKKLIHDLQVQEKLVIDYLCQYLKQFNIPYITLHDAIYIQDSKHFDVDVCISFENKFQKYLNDKLNIK